MTRRILAALIVLSWVGTLGWLAARRLFTPTERTLAREASRLAPGASFFGVTLAGTQIGSAGLTLDTLTTGFRLTEVMSLDLPDGDGRLRRHALRSEAILGRTLGLRSLAVRVNEVAASQSIDLVTTSDSGYSIRLRRNGGVEPVTGVDAAPGLTIDASVALLLAVGGRLHDGGSLASRTVDPLRRVLAARVARVGRDSIFMVSDSAVRDSVGGPWRAVAPVPTRAWRVERDGALPAIDWIDAQGRLVRREQAFGVTLERSPFEMNFNNYRAGLTDRLLLSPGRVPGTGRLVDGPGRPDTMRSEVTLVVSRADGAAWPGSAQGFAGGRQRVAGDTVYVARWGPGVVDSAPPTHQRHIGAIPAADAMILQAALREALAAYPTEPDTIARLARWVARAVRYVDTAGSPTGSVTVARERLGGLEGKVELFVALTRLVGIAARPVTGVDVSRPGLPAHAWAEIWRDGWMAIDPVFGDVPASACLLRVTEGAAPRPLVLVPLIGNLRTTMVAPGPVPQRR